MIDISPKLCTFKYSLKVIDSMKNVKTRKITLVDIMADLLQSKRS